MANNSLIAHLRGRGRSASQDMTAEARQPLQASPQLTGQKAPPAEGNSNSNNTGPWRECSFLIKLRVTLDSIEKTGINRDILRWIVPGEEFVVCSRPLFAVGILKPFFGVSSYSEFRMKMQETFRFKLSWDDKGREVFRHPAFCGEKRKDDGATEPPPPESDASSSSSSKSEEEASGPKQPQEAPPDAKPPVVSEGVSLEDASLLMSLSGSTPQKRKKPEETEASAPPPSKKPKPAGDPGQFDDPPPPPSSTSGQFDDAPASSSSSSPSRFDDAPASSSSSSLPSQPAVAESALQQQPQQPRRPSLSTFRLGSTSPNVSDSLASRMKGLQPPRRNSLLPSVYQMRARTGLLAGGLSPAQQALPPPQQRRHSIAASSKIEDIARGNSLVTGIARPRGREGGGGSSISSFLSSQRSRLRGTSPALGGLPSSIGGVAASPTLSLLRSATLRAASHLPVPTTATPVAALRRDTFESISEQSSIRLQQQLAAEKQQPFANQGFHQRLRFRLFLENLCDMLGAAGRLGFDHVVSWTPDGKAWCILDEEEFGKTVLPRFFSEKVSLAGFRKTLGECGFTRSTDASSGSAVYSHPLFVRFLTEVLPANARGGPASAVGTARIV